MIRTIGMAAQPTADDKPGDVRAASIGLEFLMKHLSGRADKKAQKILDTLREIRQGNRSG